jgi:hypothetical protein
MNSVDKRHYWEKIYREQVRSGLSKRLYCAQNGINESAYNSAVSRYNFCKTRGAEQADFLELTAVEERCQYEIWYGSYRIRVYGGTNVAGVRQALEVVKGLS